MGATRTVSPVAREGACGGGEEVRLLVVEFLDASGVVGADEAVGTAEVACARGWCGGDWSVAFPADVLVRDLGVSKASLVRNGWFLVRGQQLGRWFVVQRVLRRAPITAPDGAVLVSSWPTGARAPTRRWVRDADAAPDAEIAG